MSMFVWPDGTVTGSVDVAELEAIQKGLKGVSQKRRDSLGPIESAQHLADLLAGKTDDDPPPPEPATPKAEPKAAKAAKAAKPDPAAVAPGTADLAGLFENKPTTKKEKS